MAYERRFVEDGSTVMCEELYNNLQDGIDEAKENIKNIPSVVDVVEKGNNNPISSAGVYKELGNIEALLQTI